MVINPAYPTPVGVWLAYVGDIPVGEFVQRAGETCAEDCVDRYLSTVPDVYGVVRQASWADSFSHPWQLRRAEVRHALVAYLLEHESECDYEANASRPAPLPAPAPEGLDESGYNAPEEPPHFDDPHAMTDQSPDSIAYVEETDFDVEEETYPEDVPEELE